MPESKKKNQLNFSRLLQKMAKKVCQNLVVKYKNCLYAIYEYLRDPPLSYTHLYRTEPRTR